MFCKNCGYNLEDNLKYCPKCGNIVNAIQNIPQGNFYNDMYLSSGISDKSKLTAGLLCLFFGTFGVHRFYLGRSGSGAIMLVLAFLGIITILFIGLVFLLIVIAWALIDFIRIVIGNLTDAQGRKLR